MKKISAALFAAFVLMQSGNAGTIGVFAGVTDSASLTFTGTARTRTVSNVISFYVLDYDANKQPLAVAKYDVDTKTRKYKKDGAFALTGVSKRGIYAVGNAVIAQSSVNMPLMATLDRTGNTILRLDMITSTSQSSSTASAIIKSATANATLNRGIYVPTTPASATFAAAETALRSYFTSRGYTLATN
jgi:hypothetical protein